MATALPLRYFFFHSVMNFKFVHHSLQCGIQRPAFCGALAESSVGQSPEIWEALLHRGKPFNQYMAAGTGVKMLMLVSV